MNPWGIVDEFEKTVAKYANAPYGVACYSCTDALLLTLSLWYERNGPCEIEVPARTYVGVAQSVINAGHVCKFRSYQWSGCYDMRPTNIIDSARRFTSGMYEPCTQWCLSFHHTKTLAIGRGGMILLDNAEDAEMLKRMRYDGRKAGVKPKDDQFVRGYHCLMHPDDAARGLLLMQTMRPHNEDLPWDDYADLREHEIFTRGAYGSSDAEI